MQQLCKKKSRARKLEKDIFSREKSGFPEGLILLCPSVRLCFRNHTVVNSKVIAVTVRPEPKVTESRLEIELAHLANVRDAANHWLFSSTSGLTSWSPELTTLLTQN